MFRVFLAILDISRTAQNTLFYCLVLILPLLFYLLILFADMEALQYQKHMGALFLGDLIQLQIAIYPLVTYCRACLYFFP